ncbi:MAG: ABC transporter ATP-binding protein [Halonotius sp.]
MSVDSGEVLGVLGPVEAGKSTLANIISSFAPQNTGGSVDGELRVAGRDPLTADDNAVAMVFEDYSAQMTQARVIDEVIAPLANRGLDRVAAKERARDLLDQTQLLDVKEKFVWELSGGQQQRLAIAAALGIDPDVLVFDTATDMLDPEGKEDVANLIASLSGSTTLVVTANKPDDLVGIADTVLVINDGKQVTVDTPEAVLRDTELLRRIDVGLPLCLDVAESVGLSAQPLTPEEFADCLDDRSPTLGEAANLESDTAAADRTSIEVANAKYEYGDGTVAVNGIEMNVRDGEVHAVIGGNGAGKSTYSRLLVGLLSPDAGRIVVSGTETDESTAAKLATSIGIALQNPSKQLSEQTVLEELRFPLENRQYKSGLLPFSKEKQYDEAYIERRVEAVQNLIGLDADLLDSDPVFLPQGTQRLLTIGAALATDPDAMVLDEPTAGLDARNEAIVRDTIAEMKADGMAIVLIDHDMDFIAETADRITVLDDGQIVQQGKPAEIFARDNWSWLTEHSMRPPRVARLADKVGCFALTTDELTATLTEKRGETA